LADRIYIPAKQIYSKTFIAMQKNLHTQIVIKIATKSNVRV